MRVLVTGGAGFVGSHLVDGLISQGHQTIVLDNLTTGKMENVNTLADFAMEDITSKRVIPVIKMFQPEVVFHHAAQVGVQSSLREPYFDAKTNILGTINILEACVGSGVKKLIYASSAAAFGNPVYLGVDENHKTIPISFYGVSKHTPEHYIPVYHQIYGLDYTILRYPNVYGPRQDHQGEGGAVAIFIHNLQKEIRPVIFGDGSQTRDFIYVKDVVDANLAAMKAGSGQILNVGTGIPTSVTELLKTITKIMKIKYNPEFSPPRPGDIQQTYFNNQKATQVLGWLPKHNLEEGIKETVRLWRT